MITKTGQSIIAKYLIDQAPSYAAYIAVGCGHNPRASECYDPYTVTAANASSDIVNVTSASHTFRVGDYVTLSNVNSSLNGTHLITSVTGNYFTFSLDTEDATNTGLSASATLNFENKEKLDFEMFRRPITSRSYSVNENGLSQVIFSAELPTQETYYMSEAGIFSAGSNPISISSDSRLLHSFSSLEKWEYHTEGSSTSVTSPSEIAPVDTSIIKSDLPVVFFLDNTDDIFSSDIRDLKHLEQPRLLKSSIAIAGNMSDIDVSEATWTTVTGTYPDEVDQPHIHLTSQSYPLDVNSSSDELALAFSVIKRNALDVNPTSVYIMVEFSSEEADSTQSYARMQIELDSTDFSENDEYMYFVKKKTLGELAKSSNFSWANVKIAKVYVKIVPTTKSINNKQLTDNVATISTTAAHYVAVGDKITVSGVGSPFDSGVGETFMVTGVTSGASNTISYAKTAPNVTSTAVSPVGTLGRDGQSVFVALDGIRFENNFDMNANPLYGMTAYSPIKSATDATVEKSPNSKNLLDVKLNLDLNVGA